MAHFAVPLESYASSPVVSTNRGDSLDAAYTKMVEHEISCLAVVDDAEQLVGVVSRTDLLRVGRREAGSRHDVAVLTFPDRTVGEIMTESPLTFGPDEPVEAAAKAMVKNRLHRVFVARDGKAEGVFSTKEVMKAVEEKRYRIPVSEVMTSSVFSVRAEEPTSLAVERLEKARVTGLVVVDGEWPVGVFTQTEALEARDVARETPVEDVMSPAIICLNVETPLFRAAAQALVMNVRRIIAVDGPHMKGILTGLDFARAASG